MINNKWVMQSFLATESYGMAYKVEIRAARKSILKKILGAAIFQIVYTNSKFLYYCLVKLGIIYE